jgi:hypothetical protein
MLHTKPKLLNGIVSFTRWSIDQPSYNSDSFQLCIGDAEFLIDFGPWKAGDKPHYLIFDPTSGTLSEGNNQDELVADCVLILTPGESKTYPHAYSKKDDQ